MNPLGAITYHRLVPLCSCGLMSTPSPASRLQQKDNFILSGMSTDVYCVRILRGKVKTSSEEFSPGGTN
jgi:hypothetical protein